MLGFFGYNFLSDGNSVDPYPTSVQDIEALKIENAIYDELYVTADVTSEYSTERPTDWDFYTIIWAKFQGDLNGGNIDKVSERLDAIRIKRRKVGEFEWTTIKEYKVESADDINFVGEDLLAANETIYEYAWIPVLGGVEGNYVIAEIQSKFNGVFIADADTIYKFYAGVSYGSAQSVQQVGVFNPIGKKYPIYIANGEADYMTGSLSGQIMGNYEGTHMLNRQEMVKQRDSLLKFLKNKKAKIIKDWNGNYWLVFITGSPSITFEQSWGNGLMNLEFEWSEVGDPNNQKDLQDVGLMPIT